MAEAPPQAERQVSSDTPSVDVEQFYRRADKIHAHFVKFNSKIYGDANVLSLIGNPSADEPYLKTVILQLYLFGYQLPDTILLLTTSGTIAILATSKKNDFLKQLVTHRPPDSVTKVELLVRNKEDGNVGNFRNLIALGAPFTKVGVFMKELGSSPFLIAWEKAMSEANAESVDCLNGISALLAVKEQPELDIIKKSANLTNKVFKKSLIDCLEDAINNSKKIPHSKIAGIVDKVIEDPSKIQLNVPMEDVESCYFPIIQSGGIYDLKVSATSDARDLSADVIIASIGSRYMSYCSSITRTLFVDPPKKVTNIYNILLDMQGACMEAMVPGKTLKSIFEAAVTYLTTSDNEYLVKHLPKSLGFCIGLDFRDGGMVLNGKSDKLFRENMVFVLNVGFDKIPLSSEDLKESSSKSIVKKLKTFSVMVGDMVRVREVDLDEGIEGGEVLTKYSKGVEDVSYTMLDEDDDDDDDDEEASGEEDNDGDKKEKKKDKDKTKKKPKTSAVDAAAIANAEGKRASTRLAEVADAGGDTAAESSAERDLKQSKLLSTHNEKRLREIAKKNRKGGDDEEDEEAQELTAYNTTKDYPDSVLPNQIKVDMTKECIILPICGNPVPFHISTVKNVVLPDPDKAHYLRINFYTAGLAISKDTPANVAKLILKHAAHASFVRELTFRSLDSHNLTQAFRQISELRKRVRQRDQKEAESSNLIEQAKLVRLKEGRVPRLADLTMRPTFSGRKTIGTLEGHENGLRFRSNKQETLDIIYSNVKHAFYQPCKNEIMVLVHFHLKNPIMIGRKKHDNVQFYTEVVEASEQVDGNKRSMYDPDEMDEEQRQRQLRKRLNDAFGDFCAKVAATAKKFSFTVEFDRPYRNAGFTGAPNKEMVYIQPTISCLVNLTETPFFCVDLDQVDHVHFERVTFTSKAFDIVLLNKDFTKQPWRVDMIANTDKDGIQDLLHDMNVPFTEGPMNLNWKQIMATVVQDDRFYMNTEEDDVTNKEPGWSFLRMNGDDEEGGEESEDDSEFSDGGGSEDSEEVDDESEESDFDSESEDGSDEDGEADEELEEEGLSWEDMEKEAASDDRKRASEAAAEERNGGGGGGDKKRSKQR